MKKYLLPMAGGIIVWFFATLFFILFGEDVLHRPGTKPFVVSTVLLIIGTGLLLVIVTKLYLLLDRSKNAALRLGIIGTIVGLILDTFSLSSHDYVFPQLSDSQIIAFTVWMSFAYALYLIIPSIMNEQMKKQEVI